MELLLELLLQLVGEFLLQLVAQVLFELGLRSLREPFRPQPNPVLAALGYLLLGAIAGAISLWVAPALMIASPIGRLVNLGLTPVLSGCGMVALGAWRLYHDQALIRIDRFSYGYLFALAMALVRFFFAH